MVVSSERIGVNGLEYFSIDLFSSRQKGKYKFGNDSELLKIIIPAATVECPRQDI